MPFRIPLLLAVACGLLALALPGHLAARTARMSVERVNTAVATLHNVNVQLDWPVGAERGQLLMQAGLVNAPDLGYRWDNIEWRCPLQRDAAGWYCEGTVSAAGMRPAHLALELGVASTRASLSSGPARLSLDRDAASPDLTRLDLTQVPAQWMQALVSQVWSDGRIGAGLMSGRIDIAAPESAPLAVEAAVAIEALSVDTPDGRVATEGLGADLHIDSEFGQSPRIRLDGQLKGGELLFGTAYVSLGQRQLAIRGEAQSLADGAWGLSGLQWRDGAILAAEGKAVVAADASVDELDFRFRSADLAAMGDAYLSGWLGVAGLSDLRLAGRANGHLTWDAGTLQRAGVTLEDAGIDDPGQRFGFEGLRGGLEFSGTEPVESELRWDHGVLYGLAFGRARFPFASSDGELRSREDVSFAMLGGEVGIDRIRIRPPAGDRSLEVQFGLSLESLDIGALSASLDWPPFSGQLNGRIPVAHYADDRIELDGGFLMQLFGGHVAVSSLSMERPFGVAPTLSADLGMDGLDLEALTSVFGFGSITGRLHGRIDSLRLVDWTPVAFDAEVHTERERGVRQRISQRAVQDLSSVGDASFMGSLQGQLIGLFDDFRYSRIGIACALADEVCQMDGLGSAGRGFIIVEGSGIPRLTVVGFNRRVDWPTLVERLAAIGSGDVAPVVE